MAHDENHYLWVHEVQARLGIGETLVRKLFDEGKLDGFRTEGSGHRRITEESVERMLRDRTIGKGES